MKLIRLFPWVVAAALAGPASAFTLEAPGEFHLTADLDGDGREDVVLVDRATGVYRVGYQLAAGVHTFAAARASGIGEVTAVSAGRVLNLGRDGLVVASPWANRINLVDAPNAASITPPVPVYPLGIGPEQVLAIDVGGAGNTAHADLLSITVKNNPPDEDRRVVTRWDGTASGGIESLPLSDGYTGLNAARVQPGSPLLAGVLQDIGASHTLRLHSLATGTNVPVASAGGFRSRWAYGRFVGGALHHYLSWDAGSSNMVVRALTEPNPGVFQFGALANHNLGTAIGTLAVLRSAPTHRLLVTSPDGGTVRIYNFTGAAAPTLAQTIPAPDGTAFTGCLPLSNGEVHLFTGAPGTGRSTRFVQYQQSGGSYTVKASGSLPDPNPLGTAANVFLFANEPFVSAQPNLLRSLNGADWVSAVNIGGADVQATTERFGTAVQGLRSPTARNLGSKPAGANFALINQYRGDISIASFLPAIGDEAGDITITPPAGPQLRAVEVSIATSVPGAAFWYRAGGLDAWKFGLGSARLTLFRNTTVEFYADPGSAPRSRIHRASYTFPDPPAEQDSDSDGVPDFVELAKGLDPNGGNDSDGDGFTDKNELFAGTNPGATNSMPASKIEERASFDLVGVPKPIDGPTATEVSIALGEMVQLHDLPGNLLGTRRTSPGLSSLGSPLVAYRDAPANVGLGLLALSMESHFGIATGSPDKLIGRELLGLVPVPRVRPAEFVFAPGPGDLLGQADAWIAAAKASVGALATTRVDTRVGVPDTFAALLLERKVHQIFVQRGKPGLAESNAITLFPHRPGDVLRTKLTAEELASLREFGPGASPAWNLVDMHRAVSNGLAAPASLQLRRLALDVYRISSLSNNVVPGRYPLPVDVLRQFIATGVLHSNYLAATSLTPAQRAEAATASTQLLNGLKPRPVVNLDLAVIGATFDDDCTVLQTVPGGANRYLFSAPGVPFKFPDSFELVEGAIVRVRAFSDLEELCPGVSLEVLQAQLLSVPPVPLADLDGDLLPDDWECVFLAGDGDPDGDLDNDGITNQQEYLDGTDPGDNVYKALAKVDLSPPAILIELLGGGSTKVAWNYPAGYADKFDFQLLYSDELGEMFGPSGVSPTRLPGGGFEMSLPVEESGNRFYLLVQRLR